MRVRKLAATTLVALGACSTTVLCLAMPTAASAVVTHPFVEPPFGSFVSAKEVAVDETSGNVYIADSGTDEVKVFGASGGAPADSAPSAFNGAETPAGSFAFVSSPGEPAGVAVDNDPSSPSFGDIYIEDIGHGVVDKFMLNASHEFKYVSQLTGFSEPTGVSVDSGGNVYVSDWGNKRIVEFNAAGTLERELTSSTVERPKATAVDNAGDIYDANYEGPQNVVELTRSSLTGAIESESEPLLLGGNPITGVKGLAYDASTEDLYVDMGGEVLEYGPTHNLIAIFGEGIISSSHGIAVNGATEDIYVSDLGAGNAKIFGPEVTLPSATTGAATGVTSEGATLNGSLNPESSLLAASYQFEYGTTTGYGSKAPATPTSVGTGTSAVPVAAGISGLEPNQEYHFRLIGSNSNGISKGADETFTTLEAKPAIDFEGALPLHNSVLLEAEVNPEHSGTTRVHFEVVSEAEYEPTAPNPFVNGVSTPEEAIGSGYGDQIVGPTMLEGLKPGTVYFFRAVATNEAGTSFGEEEEAFETPAASPPTIGAVSVSGISPTGATVSTNVDPHGQSATYEVQLATEVGPHGPNYDSAIFGQVGSASPTCPGAPPSPGDSVVVCLTDLVPGVTYHYKVVSANEDGANSITGTFATPPAGPSLTEAIPPIPATIFLPTPAIPKEPVIKTVVEEEKPKPCKKGFVRKHGQCVRKHKKKKTKTKKRSSSKKH